MRMKDLMYDHVNVERSRMFQNSLDRVQAKLLKMVRTIEQFLKTWVCETLETIDRDYTAVLGGVNKAPRLLLPPDTQASARKVIIDTVDEILRTLASVSPVRKQGLTSDDHTFTAAPASTSGQTSEFP